MLIVPLNAASGVLGTIWIASHDAGAVFTSADLDVVTMLADFTAAALTLKAHARQAHEAAERERAERQRAEEAGRRKDEFLSVVSHELRTPLHAILSWSELLVEGLDADGRREAAAAIHRNARRQARMVDDLLDSARDLDGASGDHVAAVDLREIIDAVLDALAPEAQAKSLRVRSVLPAGALVDADAGRLERAVTNVIGNAVKFTPANGAVDIELSIEAGRARLRVADSGIGIAPDFLPLVFDRFSQADASSRRRHGGLGLGLTLARTLARAHGGDIRAESGGVGHGDIHARVCPSRPPPARYRGSMHPPPSDGHRSSPAPGCWSSTTTRTPASRSR